MYQWDLMGARNRFVNGLNSKCVDTQWFQKLIYRTCINSDDRLEIFMKYSVNKIADKLTSEIFVHKALH